MPRSPHAARPRPAAPSSRERILQSAKSLFAGRGYENTSTVAVARQAATSESQLMKHFGSKEGLLEAIFEDGWQRINAAARAAVDSAPTPAEKLDALVALMLTALERDPDLKLLMLLEGRRIRKEGSLVMLTGGFREFVRSFDSVLDQMRRAGRLRPGFPPDAVRSALIGTFEGLQRDQLLARRLGFPARYSAKDVRRVFSAVTATFIRRPTARR